MYTYTYVLTFLTKLYEPLKKPSLQILKFEVISNRITSKCTKCQKQLLI